MTIPSIPTAPDFPADLQPAAVWQYFSTLCAIPRPSKGEAVLRQHLQAWATAQGLESEVDNAGNLLIRKPASPDGAHLPATALQAHLDMVCQANNGTAHDFNHDPIRPTVQDGWLVAKNTTLGADNGIGVALMLAALADKTLTHGPLEALFTVDEEAGMGGARGLAPGWLTARRMLNLDTEAWGEFYLGCAGGLDAEVNHPGTPLPLPAGYGCWQLTLGGLRGGHSGVNIHEDRGNAIKLLVRVLVALQAELTLHLVSLHGGSARNALPREAQAVIALPFSQAASLASLLLIHEYRLREALTGIEPALALQATSLPANAATQCLAASDQQRWLHSLNAAPHGVWRMSQRVPGVVETSNNLGIVQLTPESGHANFMVRSLISSGAEDLAQEIVSLFALSQIPVTLSGHYPGWTPNPDSALLNTCQQVFRQTFPDEGESRVQVIHAGLECGLIADKYPGMDIVSFGPTIAGAHAPGERVEIALVGKVWTLLKGILAAG